MACSCEATDVVPLSEFLPYILPDIGDVPDEIAAHKARLACIEFAARTHQLKRTLFVDEQAGVQNYYLCVPDGYTLLSIDYVRNNCRDLPANKAADPFQTQHACSKWYAFDKPNVLYINPTPRCDNPRGIEVRVTVLPGQDTCFVDRCIYDVHAQDVAYGALAKLHMMQPEAWYDPRLAGVYERQWRDALRTAKVREDKKHTADPLIMKATRWV